jgi:arylsulfatase A-like enzyme
VQRELSNLMIESLDTGSAACWWKRDWRCAARRTAHLSARHTDTMVIVVGDNGSLGSTVKEPFDAPRAKGTAYQTGVWVPLVVAGPLVRDPDRVVSHMVNIADLYVLFGEIAGSRTSSRRCRVRSTPRPCCRTWSTPTRQHPPVELHRGGREPSGRRRHQRPLHHQQQRTQIGLEASADNNGIWWGPATTR